MALENTPFKQNGIYYRRMNRKTELENYKPSLISRFVKKVIGQEEPPLYQIIRFATKYEFDNYKNVGTETVVEITHIQGLITDLAIWFRKKGASEKLYNNLFYNNDYATFENDKLKFKCHFNNQGLELVIKRKKTNKIVFNEQFIFISG